MFNISKCIAPYCTHRWNYMTTSDQRILTRPHRRERAGFSRWGGKLQWHHPVESTAVDCSSRNDAVIGFLVCIQQL